MTDKKPSKGAIEPVQLTGRSRFRFRCHSGLSCWRTCCHEMDIMLTPLDVLRLKRKLNLRSEVFLDHYTEAKIHEESSLPLVILKHVEGEGKACPFLTDEGCGVYEDRPSICRYYPIGLGTLRARRNEDGKVTEERFYFPITEDYCLGHGEEKEWTVDEWRADQGADRDDEINLDWQQAFLSRSLPGEQKLDSRRQSQFHLVCYNLDAFRRFVFESPFLEQFDIDDGTVEKIREDDDELLRFALRYMKYFMMIEETMKPKRGVVERWKVRKRDSAE